MSGIECPGCGGTYLGLKNGRCAGCNARRADPTVPATTLTTLRAENERLREALTLAVRWLGDSDNPTETFEDIGEWFRRETGYLRPGKSLPMEMGDMDEERRRAWDAWVETKGREVRDRARAALKGG